MTEKKLRVIKIKGKEYVQEVIYKWDREKKRGKTEIVRHLGPINKLSAQKITEIRNRQMSNKTRRENENINLLKENIEENTIRTKAKSNPSLTPDDKLINHVLSIILETTEFMSRSEVYEKLLNDEPSFKEGKELKTLVGFALTILERESRVKKIGEGRRGNPFKYGYL